ncbi:MAG: GNAT family N-acetyltransferase [Pseudomonadota bacterium]
MIEIRAYRPGDADALGLVFHRSVREGARHAYSAAQVAAWSPAPPSGPDWQARLNSAFALVAVIDAAPVGFMTMNSGGFAKKGGYIDLAFVLPEQMGTGVANSLYAVLENHARAEGLERLTTQASLLAEPFFARHGWYVTERQTVTRTKVDLPNAWMEKTLASA